MVFILLQEKICIFNFLSRGRVSTVKPAHSSYHLKVVYILIIAILIIIPGKGHCRGIFDGGIGLGVASPQGEFRDNVDRNGFNFSGCGLFRPGLVPLKFGLELGYVNYGSEDRREPFSSSIPDVKVRVERTNNIFLSHFLVRLQPDVGVISPYFDGLVGMNYLWTSTHIRDVDNFQEIASSKNLDDLAFSYGLGGGIMFKVYETSKIVSEHAGQMFFDSELGVGSHFIIKLPARSSNQIHADKKVFGSEDLNPAG